MFNGLGICDDKCMKNPLPSLYEPWQSFEVRKREPELKREMLLKTAAHLFLERGYRKTSMNDLAEMLKISKPALYHYFRNKDEILVGCYENGIASIDSVLNDMKSHAGTGLERARAYVRKYAEAILMIEFGQCVATLNDSDLMPKTRAKVKRLKRRIDSSMRRVIEEGIKDGSIRPCNSKLVSFAIAGAINWIGMWYDPAGPLKAEDIIESYTDFLVSGFAMHSGSKGTGKRRAANVHPVTLDKSDRAVR